MRCTQIGARYAIVLCAIVLATTNSANEIYLEGIDEPLATVASAAYEAALEGNLNLTPDRVAERWGELGMLMQAHNLHEQAIVAYSNALIEIADPRWLYLRGIAFGELGLVQKSVDDLMLVTRSMREIAIIWYRLGQALLDAGQTSDAKEALTKALTLDAELAIAHMRLADAQMLETEYEQAKGSLQRAYGLQPQAGQIAYRLALVERALGDLKSSQIWLERRTNQFAPAIEDPMMSMVAQYSTNPTFFISAARRAWERGDRDTAVEAYRRAIQLAPENTGNLIGYTQLLTVLSRYDEALKVLETLERVSSDEAMLWYLRAVIFLEKDLVPEAEDAIKKAIAIAPTEQVLALEREIGKLREYD